MNELPKTLDVSVYRKLHADMRDLDDDAVIAHYRAFGQGEGRSSNAISDRATFARLAAQEGQALEIGPFANPLLRGPDVRYADVCSEEQLRARAKALGLDPSHVPHINFVLGDRGLAGINQSFNAVLSSHCIEHQPDLVAHLQQVQRLIEPARGRYFLLVPDKRYCFDRFIAESTIADVLEANEQRRKVHTLRSVIEHRALTTHNDPLRHWSERSALRSPINPSAVRDAANEWRAAKGSYIDVHAWYFTPNSFMEMIELLNGLELIQLRLERLYPTRRVANEFWAVLGCER